MKTVKVQWHPAGGAGSDRRFPLGATRVAHQSRSDQAIRVTPSGWGWWVAWGCGAPRSGIAIDWVTGRSSLACGYGQRRREGWLNVQSGPRKPLEACAAPRGERGPGTKATHEKWEAPNPWGGMAVRPLRGAHTEWVPGPLTSPDRSRLGQGPVSKPSLEAEAHGKGDVRGVWRRWAPGRGGTSP